MNIEPNENNWSVRENPAAGEWHLIYKIPYKISLFQAVGPTSTESNLFVGTLEECQNKINELNLTDVSNICISTPVITTEETEESSL